MAAKFRLLDVTLLTVTSVDIEETHATLLYCGRDIEFGAVKMFSPVRPRLAVQRVQYIEIPQIDFVGYSRFMIESLNGFVETSHCLVIQADGFILDASRWQRRFLDYDYIGAPWPETVALQPGNRRLALNRNAVGNGGFPLRSKKLLEATARSKFDVLDYPLRSEDLLICHYLYDEMRAAGISFAPPDIAAQFSIETPLPHYGQSLGNVFGFHGRHLLAQAYQNHALLKAKVERSKRQLA